MAGLRIAGVWEKTAPNGEVYYEGPWGNTLVRVYSNKYKKSEKDPDCVIYLSERPNDKRKPAPTKVQANVPFRKPIQGPAPAKRYDPPGEMPDTNDVPWPDSNDEPNF